MSKVLAPDAFIQDLVMRIESRRTFGSHPLWLELADGSLRQNELGSRRKAEDRSHIPEVAVAMWQAELDQTIAALSRVLRQDTERGRLTQ